MDLFSRPAYVAAAFVAAAASVLLWTWSEARRARLAAAFAREETLRRLYPAEAIRARELKHWLKTGSLFLCLLALAGPQWGVELVATQSSATQAVVAVDVSLSMLSEDVKPSRMERAKDSLSLILDGLRGERVGLVAFAGEAQIQCPITTDSEAVKSFLRRMSPGAVPQAGTALGKAIALAARMLGPYPGQKGLILLTDGEDHEGKVLDAAREAAAAGMRIFVIGMGTPEGAPIPIKEPDGRIGGYKKDSKGNTVITRLAEQGLVEIAAAGGGAYFRATSSGAEVTQILDQIRGLERGPAAAGSATRYRNRYRIPLLLAFLLLLAELLLAEDFGSLSLPRSWRPRLGSEAASLLAFAALLSSGCQAPTDARLWRGNSAYAKERYDEALSRYEAAAEAAGKDPRPLFNSGAALYKMGEHERAQKAFEAVSDPEKTAPALAAKSLYNTGNSLYRQEKAKEAAQAYKKCLLLDPSDEDCRYNLVVALREPDKKKDKDKEKEKKKDPNNDKNGEDKKDPQPPKQDRDRPQGLSREDAERILQAVKEKERAAMKALPARPQPAKPGRPASGEDW